jgi:single-strand DNA-binding protein
LRRRDNLYQKPIQNRNFFIRAEDVMNQIMIAGHLGSDPEVRFTSSGKKVTTFRVATNIRKGGQEETIWWRVTVWGEEFDNMIAHLKKGSSVIVFGELQKPEIFTDREGHSQVSMNITAHRLQFSPFGRPNQRVGTESHVDVEMAGASNAHVAQGQGQMDGSLGDDEIPF